MNARTLRRFGAILLIAACAAGPAAAAPAQTPAPRAVFKTAAHDFGTVKQGDVLTCEFVFRNEGGAPLVVEKVETTCGCTAALVSEKTVAPGREGKVKASFDTRGYSGRMSRFIYIVTNEGGNRRHELSLSADIQVPPSARIDIDRYNIDLGIVLEGDTLATRIVIKSTGQRELKVEMAQENVEFFSGGKRLAGPIFLPAGDSREIELRFPPQARTGSVRDYILLKSNDPVRSTMSIYVSRYVISRKEMKELFEKYRSVLK